MSIFGTLETLLKNSYADIQPFGQFMNAFIQIFVVDKFQNGETGRDAAINALIAELQTQLSTYKSPTTYTSSTIPPKL